MIVVDEITAPTKRETRTFLAITDDGPVWTVQLVAGMDVIEGTGLTLEAAASDAAERLAEETP